MDTSRSKSDKMKQFICLTICLVVSVIQAHKKGQNGSGSEAEGSTSLEAENPKHEWETDNKVNSFEHEEESKIKINPSQSWHGSRSTHNVPYDKERSNVKLAKNQTTEDQENDMKSQHDSESSETVQKTVQSQGKRAEYVEVFPKTTVALDSGNNKNANSQESEATSFHVTLPFNYEARVTPRFVGDLTNLDAGLVTPQDSMKYRDIDSSEQEQNAVQIVTMLDDFIEDGYVNASRSLGNLTKTDAAAYQGNRSDEGTDDLKSTLIDYPFSASIQRKGAHYASGALLDKRWIITVAGEFYNVRDTLKLFKVRLGSVDCKRGGTVVPIKKIEIHPYYIYKKPNFDVALVRLATLVEFSDYVRPIAISTIKGKVLSAKFMTTYWPRVVVKGSILPKTAMERVKHNSMRVSMQRLIPENKCLATMKGINEILHESSLCLKPVVAQHTICMPDVGAPIVAADGLWGITSGWISHTLCPDVAPPTIFTRLSSPPVRSWLNTLIHHSH